VVKGGDRFVALVRYYSEESIRAARVKGRATLLRTLGGGYPIGGDNESSVAVGRLSHSPVFFLFCFCF
jgi:hypothetical protein